MSAFSNVSFIVINKYSLLIYEFEWLVLRKRALKCVSLSLRPVPVLSKNILKNLSIFIAKQTVVNVLVVLLI